jgi:hypothetical protein
MTCSGENNHFDRCGSIKNRRGTTELVHCETAKNRGNKEPLGTVLFVVEPLITIMSAVVHTECRMIRCELTLS